MLVDESDGEEEGVLNARARGKQSKGKKGAPKASDGFQFVFDDEVRCGVVWCGVRCRGGRWRLRYALYDFPVIWCAGGAARSVFFLLTNGACAGGVKCTTRCVDTRGHLSPTFLPLCPYTTRIRHTDPL